MQIDQHVRRQRGSSPSSCLPGMPHSVCSNLGIPIVSGSSTQKTKTSQQSKASNTNTLVKSKGTSSPSSHKELHSDLSSLGVSAKAGISVGVTVAAAVGILVLLLLCRKRRAKAERTAQGADRAETGKQGLFREKSIKAYFIPSWKSELSGVPAPAELEGSSGRVERAELRESNSAVELGDAAKDDALKAQNPTHGSAEGSKHTDRSDDVRQEVVLPTAHDASHSNGMMKDSDELRNGSPASHKKDTEDTSRAEKDTEDGTTQQTEHDVPRSDEITDRDEKADNEISALLLTPPPIPYASKPMSR